MTIYELAELLHTKLCRWNHMDGCDWHYRIKDKDRWTYISHRQYLEKAEDLIRKTGMHIDDIAKVVNLL